MPVLAVRSEIPGVGAATEAVIDASGLEGRTTLQVEALEGTASLVIVVTDTGSDGHLRGPRDVRVDIIAPDDDADFAPESLRSNEGQVVLLIPDPHPGTWTIELAYGPDGAAQVNTASLRKGWQERLLRGGRWLACRTCTVFLRALLAAVLVHLYGLVASGATLATILQQMPTVLLESLKSTLSLEDPGISDLITFLLEYVVEPIDRALHAMCSWLGLCPPEVGRRGLFRLRPTDRWRPVALGTTQDMAEGIVPA
jgi:hypothetical protein